MTVASLHMYGIRNNMNIDKNNLEQDYQTMSETQIAEKYQTSRYYISKLLKEYNITKKPSDIEKHSKLNNLTQEIFYNLYVNQNKSYEEIGELYNATARQVKRLNNEKYKCKKNKQDIIANRCKGINTYLQSENAKNTNKLALEKRNKTLKEKYGVTNVFQLDDVKNKIKETNLEKYGVENVGQNPEIQNKAKQTMVDRYGVTSMFAKPEVKEKVKASLIKRFGTTHFTALEEVQNKIKETNLEKYGVEYTCLTDNCISKLQAKDSKPNLAFKQLLEDANIMNYEREYRISNRSYDFKIINTLIEINPSATHNHTYGIHGQAPMEIEYHKNKSNLAIENGFHCIHIFDWENPEKILHLIQPKETIGARKCEIKEVSIEDTNTFLNQYHIQGSCQHQTIRLGLYYNNELVEIMTFGKPRYSKITEFELLRLCTIKTHTIVGGSSKLFNYFINNYNPKSIVSYCDLSKFTGDVYKQLGFKLKNKGVPTRHWYNIKTGAHYTDNFIRKHGYDNLFGTSYGKGTSNIELMRQNGYVEVYDCGQATYIWTRPIENKEN